MVVPASHPAPSVVCPGNHDGVHRGHRALLAAARGAAAKMGCKTIALTFDPHPATVLAPDKAPVPLTTLARRTELLRRAGADEIVAQHFDRAFASIDADTFVRDFLVAKLAARAVVVGHNYRFGAGAAGDVARLRSLGDEHGFEVVEVDPVEHEGAPISSTRIRATLGEGDVAGAAAMLDRFHDIDGVVVRGDQRGRTIGFPTANLKCEPVLVPADGVYAVVLRQLEWEHAAAKPLRGVANIGVRPTFGAGRSVEVYLLDFDGDLYDRRVRLGLVARIRPEMRFAGVDALKAQIGEDVERARGLLAALTEDALRWI